MASLLLLLPVSKWVSCRRRVVRERRRRRRRRKNLMGKI